MPNRFFSSHPVKHSRRKTTLVLGFFWLVSWLVGWFFFCIFGETGQLQELFSLCTNSNKHYVCVSCKGQNLNP